MGRVGGAPCSHGCDLGFVPLLWLFWLCLPSWPLLGVCFPQNTGHSAHKTRHPAFLWVRFPKARFPRGPGGSCEAQNNTTWKAQNVTLCSMQPWAHGAYTGPRTGNQAVSPWEEQSAWLSSACHHQRLSSVLPAESCAVHACG